jgi:hypothetical protein
MRKYKRVDISHTDGLRLFRLLWDASDIIYKRGLTCKEQNTARQCRQFMKKLIKKIDYDSNI